MSVAASEGVPAYRVTFDVSDDEEQYGDPDDTGSILGDGTSNPYALSSLLLTMAEQTHKPQGLKVK